MGSEQGHAQHDRQAIDYFAQLKDIWTSRSGLAEKALRISEVFAESGLPFDAVVDLLGCSPAEFQAMLFLSMLEDDKLRQLSELKPAMTTWYLFAMADERSFAAGIEALKERKKGQSSFMAVYEAIRSVAGPDVYERLNTLNGKTLWHMAKKAKEYQKLRDKDRRFLGDMARRRSAGRSMTPRQLKYLHGLLTVLAEEGVICANSPDKDQNQCDEVLRALGR